MEEQIKNDKAIIQKQDKINNLKNELIVWLNDECPAVFPPLEPYTTADLSHNFAESLRIRLNEITIQRGELSLLKEQGEKTLDQPDIREELPDDGMTEDERIRTCAKRLDYRVCDLYLDNISGCLSCNNFIIGNQ